MPVTKQGDLNNSGLMKRMLWKEHSLRGQRSVGGQNWEGGYELIRRHFVVTKGL